MRIRTVFLAFLAILAWCPAGVCGAAELAGTVRDAREAPLAGVLVTLTSADRLFAESAYSDRQGRFALPTTQRGALTLRARKLGFGDAQLAVELPAAGTVEQELVLTRLESPEAVSEQLTASGHFTRLEFADPRDQGFFHVECLTCHQLGNAYTRAPRAPEQWRTIVARMLGFFGPTLATKERVDRYAELLAAGFDGTPLVLEQTPAIDPALFEARITQWKLPGAVIAHDVEYHSEDGKFYTVDQGKDLIYITDPRSNVTETFVIPSNGIPVGGKFLAVFNEPHPFSLAVSRGPHSLQEGPDGKFYITDTVSGQIGVFDPATRTYTGHDIGGKAMYPHTIRFDQRGTAWFTLGVSNQVGRFEPSSGEMTLIDLPATSDRPAIEVLMPYGIDIHPRDGSVWYSRLMANRIGRIDPETLAVEEFQPPLIGPRRMRFDAEGTLWIPSYGTGELVRLDTAAMQYTRYRIPPLSPREVEAPYAVGVHPQTQEIWITANMSDRMFRFIPAEERFIAYPLPTRGIFLRDVIFTPAGEVCAASSMAAAPLAVEGGMEEVICLDPGTGG